MPKVETSLVDWKQPLSQLIQKSWKNLSKISSVPSSLHSLLASIIADLSKDSVIVVVATNTEAEFLHRESLSFVKEGRSYYFPGQEVLPYEYMRYPQEMKRERIKALAQILSGEKVLIFTSVAGFLKTLPAPSALKGRTIRLEVGQELELNSLLKDLSQLGYSRKDVCEAFGEFSLKGGILDVFFFLFQGTDSNRLFRRRIGIHSYLRS